MKYLLFIIFSILFCFKTKPQNLVPNSSFENYIDCPNGFIFDNSILQSWFSPISGVLITHGYQNECSTNSINSVPNNFIGYEYAASGKGYIYLLLYSRNFNDVRQYISAKFTTLLLSNKYYKVSLKYSLPDSVNTAAKNLGIYFSDTAITTLSAYTVLPFSPQLHNNTGFLDNKNGWTTLDFLYKANGTEQYLTMGNFENDANTETKNINGPKEGAAIYIDDVSVSPYNCYINPIKDTSICYGDTMHIVLNNTMATYTWQDGSTAANYTITQPGNYTFTTTANGCSRSDTIKVKPQTISAFNLGANSSICNTEQLKLQGPPGYQNYLWQDGSTQPQYLVTQPGLYWLQAGTGNCNFRDSINITKVECACIPLIPIAFSPNGDGLNEEFAPIIRCNTTQYKLIIFNRYGQTVFSSNNNLQKWNGRFKGFNCDNGAYIYQLQYLFRNTPLQTTKGSFLLVR